MNNFKIARITAPTGAGKTLAVETAITEHPHSFFYIDLTKDNIRKNDSFIEPFIIIDHVDADPAAAYRWMQFISSKLPYVPRFILIGQNNDDPHWNDLLTGDLVYSFNIDLDEYSVSSRENTKREIVVRLRKCIQALGAAKEKDKETLASIDLSYSTSAKKAEQEKLKKDSVNAIFQKDLNHDSNDRTDTDTDYDSLFWSILVMTPISELRTKLIEIDETHWNAKSEEDIKLELWELALEMELTVDLEFYSPNIMHNNNPTRNFLKVYEYEDGRLPSQELSPIWISIGVISKVIPVNGEGNGSGAYILVEAEGQLYYTTNDTIPICQFGRNEEKLLDAISFGL